MNTGISLWTMSHDCCVLQMCAPYSALQSYKLKVKMTPGSQRKGRAARQVLRGHCTFKCTTVSLSDAMHPESLQIDPT